MKPPLQGGAPDDFQTPAEALAPLYPYMKPDWIVWEPAQGKGNLAKAFRKNGFNTIGTDILTGEDFLTYLPHTSFDCIVTNPPFSLKQRFLVRAYELGKPFALLLPLTTLETKARQDLFKRYGVEIILFDRRIDFETPHQAESKSWFATAWFTHGLHIGRELTFTQLRPQSSLDIPPLPAIEPQELPECNIISQWVNRDGTPWQTKGPDYQELR